MRIPMAILMSVVTGTMIAYGSDTVARNATQAAAPTKVLFMCPHGAGKSVLASAYFQKLAKERGLNVVIDAAGTDPDPAIGPAVADHLKKNAIPLAIEKPRRVTADDLAKADIVVSLGCDMKGLPQPGGRLLTWNDVPGPGEDLAGSSEAIRKHVETLVDDLLRATRGAPPEPLVENRHDDHVQRR